MANKEKKVFNTTQYSEESISTKLKIIYFFLLVFKIILFTPFIHMILKELPINYLNIIRYKTMDLRILWSLLISIFISFIFTKKTSIKNPLFLDDKIVISNKKKNNGNYEDIYIDKFKLLCGFNLIFIIPLGSVIALTISSILCIALSIIKPIMFLIPIIKYFLTLLILYIISTNFNKYTILYLKNKI